MKTETTVRWVAGLVALVSLGLAAFVNLGWLVVAALFGTFAFAGYHGPEWVLESSWKSEEEPYRGPKGSVHEGRFGHEPPMRKVS